MAKYVTINQLKDYLFLGNITEYDDRLGMLLDAAESKIIGLTDFPEDDVRRIAVPDFPADLKQAIIDYAAFKFAGNDRMNPGLDIRGTVRRYERLCGGSALADLIDKAKENETAVDGV
jgi:hypothetical protein